MRSMILTVAAAFLAATLAGAPVHAAKTKTNFGAIEDSAPKQKRKKIAIAKKKTVKPRTAERRRGNARVCASFFRCLTSAPRAGTTARRAGFFSGIGGGTRQSVAFSGKYAPGTVIVRTPERALYYVLPGGRAIRYRVGVGKDGFQWSGSSRVGSKREWPDWRPPARMIAREAAKGRVIPEYMAGGPGNPLGARAIYIAGTLFRIHGTNNPSSIGGAVSSGCIRMMNADVIDLYGRVRVGNRVIVTQ